MTRPLLEVHDLAVRFSRRRPPVVDGISFSIAKGERVGLIGESGSGKSVTALALMGLLEDAAKVSGSATLDGHSLLGQSDKTYATLRGSRISMVFQEPMTALDPTMVVGRQVAEVLRLHQGAPSGKARPRVAKMLESMGIKEVERVMDSYPHQLSGGQRQRVLIAMALINTPDLLICDEPTTALDVTVQSRVLWRLEQGLKQAGAAMLFISHDLAVVSYVCDRIMVMYQGRIVETGSTKAILNHPQHPYTKGLIATADLLSRHPGEKLPVLEDFWTGA